MKKNATIAMVAALTITSAAGVGIGGYMMGHKIAAAPEQAYEITSRDVSNAYLAGLNDFISNTKTVTMSDVARTSAEMDKIADTTTTNTNTTNSNTNNNIISDHTKPVVKKVEPRKFTVTPADYTVYCNIPALNVRTAPETATGSVIGSVKLGDALHVTGKVDGFTWLQVNYNGQTAYVSSPYVSKEKPDAKKAAASLVLTMDSLGHMDSEKPVA